MLTITIPAVEYYNEATNTFFTQKEQTIQLEHSLVSIAKWEAKWTKPFLGDDKKTDEEMLDYIRCMTLTQNVDPNIYFHLSRDNVRQINEYIEAPMTATWFSDHNEKKKRKEAITAEIIYYSMIALNIPFECQKWHLNRLLTLIKVCNIKNTPPKKRSKKDTLARNRALNEERRKKYNTSG